MFTILAPSLHALSIVARLIVNGPTPWVLFRINASESADQPQDTESGNSREADECYEDLQPVIDGVETGQEEILDVNATNEPI